MELDPPAHTIAQLFFVPPSEDGYTQKNSLQATVKPGRSVLFFQIPAFRARLPLRFDPAAVPGCTVIYSLDVYAAQAAANATVRAAATLEGRPTRPAPSDPVR